MGAARIATNREVSSACGASGDNAVATGSRVGYRQPPALQLTDSAAEAIKWVALCLMTLDHVDKYLLHGRVYALFALGRIAFPLFATVLAFNLARPGAVARGVYPRVLLRLAIFGGISEVPFIALGGLAWGWYPLNILFALLVSAAMMWILERQSMWCRAIVLLVFLVGGAFVEFWWPGIALSVAAWLYFRRPRWTPLLMWLAAIASLYMINGNYWSLVAVPVIVFAPWFAWKVGRVRWAFYSYYPAHLVVIWGVSRWVEAR